MENSAVEHNKYMMANTASDFGCVHFYCVVRVLIPQFLSHPTIPHMKVAVF
jgi:hypothetical protein